MGAQRWLCRAIAESFSDFRWENKQGIAGEEQRQPDGAGRATLLLLCRIGRTTLGAGRVIMRFHHGAAIRFYWWRNLCAHRDGDKDNRKTKRNRIETAGSSPLHHGDGTLFQSTTQSAGYVNRDADTMSAEFV